MLLRSDKKSAVSPPGAHSSRQLLVDAFVKPHARLADPSKRATARLLAGCLLALIFFFGTYDSYVALSEPDYSPPLPGYALLLLAYSLTRLGYFGAASLIALSVIPAVGFVLVLTGNAPTPTFTLSLPILSILLGTLLAGARTVLAISFLSVAMTLVIVMTPGEFQVPLGLAVGPLMIVGVGGALGALSIMHRDRLERERRRTLSALASDLELKVKERTEELAQTVRELEAFSYSVSHDLRAPLRAIEGFASILEEDHGAALGEEGRETLGVVQSSAARMSALIDGLLRLSRVTRAPIQVQEVDLVPLAQQIVRTLAGAGNDSTLLVVPQSLVVRADPDLIVTILENLLGNAYKFTRAADQPRIELGVVLRDGAQVCFVRDNGVGFDMAHERRLFRPFERLHKEGEFAGTGIGLATVQRAVERHGGTVCAEAELGRFAAFYFTLGV